MPSKTVVIIGGSYSGIGVAKALLKSSPGVKIVIIDPSDRFYFNIAAPRILAKPEAFSPDKYLYPITTIFRGASKDSFEFVQNTVSQIDTSSKVVTTSNGIISYDYLVIASGSSSQSTKGDGVFAPFKPTGVDSRAFQVQIKAAQDTVAAAESIIIGGAGPLGVEIAGELSDTSNHKNITVIASSSRILPMLKEGPSSTAEKLLAKKNVNIVKGASVIGASQNGTKWIVKLSTGKEMAADAYIATTGVVPNSSFIPSEYLVNGWVNVDPHLRVATPGNLSQRPQGVYAVGDITIHSPRTLIKANEQVPVVAANIKADIDGGPKLKTYNAAAGSIMMAVPVGENAGTGQAFGWTIWGKLVSMMKGKDFMISRAPGMIGISS
ncbi:hypothetical protein P175DRAFT_0498833 [Aspergillus ochraceoroseus IBT 24754]|uniref:FAD/NAD(P)-binding domain-containing protein n=2 Tax=Aspergillus ochraceoroseus TaxID=138278 RepID=A0A2T5M1A2_9EURO|nr:uncharacterized protein P175DRAFT_0498833 [Aspergillus ochraceoroseus IBT 24754]KKK21135.1 hypothetical protein AOCH_002929 [Aspergillus ochraceoroseus]PTU22299.1 hypothetical protein P175DRAFT_0498833 [Aspergillus ochraceoroseus IBT 24754]